jgi:hypothetical protein
MIVGTVTSRKRIKRFKLTPHLRLTFYGKGKSEKAALTIRAQISAEKIIKVSTITR